MISKHYSYNRFFNEILLGDEFEVLFNDFLKRLDVYLEEPLRMLDIICIGYENNLLKFPTCQRKVS